MPTLLFESQQQFISELHKGTVCPVCSRYAKVYGYVISPMLAKLLKALIGQGWIRYKDFPKIAAPNCPEGKAVTNYNVLKYWGLIERHTEETKWRATDKAIEFVEGRLAVPRKLVLCFDNVLSVSSETVTFSDALQGINARKSVEMQSTSFSFPAVVEGINTQDAIERHNILRLKGTYCALCGRWNQVYRRAMNCEMARVLMCIFSKSKTAPGSYFHAYNDCKARGGEYAQMEWWGLIAKHPTEDRWKITENGRLFCAGHIKVKSHVITLNDTLLDLDGTEIDIHTALNTPFDENDLRTVAAAA